MTKLLRSLASWFFLLFLSTSGFAEIKYSIPEDPNPPFVTVLDNGLQVAIKKVPLSEMVSCQLWVHAGSLTEGDYIGSGISHYLEHLLFKGTEKRGVGEIAQQVERMGGYINAYTSFERTVFTIDLPANFVNEGVDILADVAVNATLDLEEFEKEKRVILQELSFSNDNPEKKAARLLWQNAFRTHPYRYPVIGYKPVFEKITRDQVMEYYKRLYVPNNMLLVITGKVDPKETLKIVEKYFEPLERKSVAPLAIPEEPPQVGKRYLIIEKPVNKTHFYLSFHGPRITSPDVPPMDVLASILGQGKSSRLYKKLREEKNLAYSIEAWSYTPKEPGLFSVSATLASENIDALKEGIWEEILEVQKNGVTEEEVQKAKASILKEILGSQETAKGEAENIGSNLFTTEDADFTNYYLRQVMKVTPEQVQKVARDYFAPEKEILTVLKPVEEKSAEASPQEQAKASEVIKKVLPNGMTLLMQDIPGLPIVSIKAVFKGGVLTENKKINGVSYLMTRLFLKGTRNQPRQSFMNELELYGGEMTSYTGYNSFGCQMNLLSPFWKEGIRLMQEAVLTPNFNEADLEQEKNVIQAGIQAREDDPFDAAGKLLRESLFVEHPYRLQTEGDLDSVGDLKLKDVKSYYNRYVNPKNLVFTVVGDIEPDEVQNAVQEFFSGFKAKKEIPFPNPKQEMQNSVRKLVKIKPSNQAVVTMGFHGVDLYNEDQYALEIIASIYSGQGSRLFTSVREERGLAYSVGAYQVLGLDPGFFTFYAGTRPDKGEEVVAIILNELQLLKESGITEEELIRAQNGLIGEQQKLLESSGRFAFKISLDELYGLGYDFYKKYEDSIRSVTRDDIIRVARKYFNENQYSLIIVKPEEE